MKLLPKNTRVEAGGPLDLTIGAAVVITLFFLAGFGLDRWLGTTPLLMIVFTVLGAIGLFVRFKYRYDEHMAKLEAARRTGGLGSARGVGSRAIERRPEPRPNDPERAA